MNMVTEDNYLGCATKVVGHHKIATKLTQHHDRPLHKAILQYQMRQKKERLSELEGLIRAAHAEIGTLQFLLISAYENGLDPGELGIQIADLGRQISAWEKERGPLSGPISGRAKSARVMSTRDRFVPESSPQG
jgi:hypothetical protein